MPTVSPESNSGTGHQRLTIICAIAFLLGVAGRWYWIFYGHPATDYIYTDMKVYVDYALRLSDPNYVGGIADTYYPPGMGMMMSLAYQIDGTWRYALIVQFLLSVGTQILVFAIAFELYGRRAALCSLAIVSLYFPLVDFAAFFMAENPFTFLVLLSFWLMLVSMRTVSWRHTVPLAMISGAALGLATQFKAQALLPGVFVLFFLTYVGIRYRWRKIAGVIGALSAGVLLVLVPFSIRASQLNEGRFCLVATNGPVCFLVGHVPDLGMVVFDDRVRNYTMWFLAPPVAERRIYETEKFPFGAYETDKVMALAWERIKKNKTEAVLMSIDHVFETLFGIVAFPSSGTKTRRLMDAFQKGFVLLIFFPALCYLAQNAFLIFGRHPAGFADVMICLPIIGLLVVMMLFTIGETRYRIPFDCFFIILAAQFYVSAKSGTIDNVFTRVASLNAPRTA